MSFLLASVLHAASSDAGHFCGRESAVRGVTACGKDLSSCEQQPSQFIRALQHATATSLYLSAEPPAKAIIENSRLTGELLWRVKSRQEVDSAQKEKALDSDEN